MKRTAILSALALVTAMPIAAVAADLDYSYLEGGWTAIEADGGSDADGWTLGGSAAVAPNIHIYGSYAGTELDDANIDANIARLGIGWNTGISERSDMVVRANYVKLDTDFAGADSDGYEAELGFRTGFTPNLETYVAAGYADIDRGSGGDLYAKLGAQFKFNPSWGIVASATLSEEANEFFVGPRLNF